MSGRAGASDGTARRPTAGGAGGARRVVRGPLTIVAGSSPPPWTLVRSRSIAPPSVGLISAVTVLSASPGRLRVRVAGLAGQRGLANFCTDGLAMLPGVRALEANTRSGCLSIRFDPDVQSSHELIGAVELLRRNALKQSAPQAQPR